MAINPYRPMQSEAHPRMGPLDVVVQRRFPLEIVANREVNIATDVLGSTEALAQRVQRAARSCGYKIETQSEDKWTLFRGSLWLAVFTFDVRKLPTKVSIERVAPTRLQIDLLCSSALTISTPGDAERIGRELDALEVGLFPPANDRVL